jgi:hypothetical protein
MIPQVILVVESLTTLSALKRFIPCVLTFVDLQLFHVSKNLWAFIASIRLIAGMSLHVLL